MADDKKKGPKKEKKGCGCLILALVFLILGVGGGAALMVGGIGGFADMIDSANQMDFPGEKVMTFNKPGTYTIFNIAQTQSGFVGAGDIDVSVKSTEVNRGGLKVGKISGESSFNVNNQEAVGLLQFTVEEAGDYTVKVDSEKSGILAITKFSLSDAAGAGIKTLVGMALIGVGGLLALISLIVGVVKMASGGKKKPA